MFDFLKRKAPNDPTAKDISRLFGNVSLDDLKEMVTNASTDSSWRNQLASMISGGNFTGDTMHNISLDFGYPDTLTFTHFWNMYRRFGIARNVCELPVDMAWLQEPEITSEDEGFLTEFGGLAKRVKFWQRLVGLDKRQRVGRYAGMFMQVRDGKAPDKPIDGTLSGPSSLVKMVPIYEGQLRVSTTENDATKDDFGMPTMYQFQSSGVGNRNEQASAAFSIHPDRLIMAAEGADDGGIYGIPSLESPYNSLMDLRKIIGGGAEGFYKNASQSVIFNLKDTANAKGNEAVLDKFNDNFDDFQRDRFRRGMWMPGMDAKVLESSGFAQPKDYFMNGLHDVGAGAKIPATILIGQQTGRLASNEDSRSFLSGLNSRNANYGTDLVTRTVDWCMKFGILRSAMYEVEWSDLLALSMQEKLENALKMAESNAKQFEAGGETSFTGEEIRSEAGFDEIEEGADFVNASAASETNLNNARAAESLSRAVTNFVTLGGEEAMPLETFLKAAGFSDEDVAAGAAQRDKMLLGEEPGIDDDDEGGE